MVIWQPQATFTGVIDVSDNNGAIKWSLVPAPILLTFIKAGQGQHHVDPLFKANWEGALDTGRLPVPYHWLDQSPVTAQVDNFVRAAGIVAGMPVMIDWEPDPRSNIRPSIVQMQNFGAAMQKIIKRGPLAYHGMYDLSSPIINAWPWFIPKYSGKPPRGPKYLFWQNSPNLVVPGITHPTDHSIFSGTEAELRAWHATGAMPAGFP